METGSADVVRAYFDAWHDRDAERLAAALAADVEWERSADFPDGRVLRGRERVVEFARSMWDVFSEVRADFEECAEVADGVVLVVGSSRFLGGASGAETTASWVRIYRVGPEGIFDIRPYPDRDAALAAARA